MKKLSYLFGVVLFAAAFTSCSIEDNSISGNSGNTETPETPQIKNGDDLKAAIEQYATVINGVPTLTLPKGFSVTLNEAVELNAPLTIVGELSGPAHVTVGENGKFVTTSGIKLENLVIDASAQTEPLVTLGVEAPEEWTFSSLTFSNLNITGLKKALTYAACKNYDVCSVVENCDIQVAADVTVFDYTKGSVAIIFNINNTTIWAPEATGKALYSSQGGQKATEVAEGTLQQFDIENSTFYNLTKSKNFFSHRQSNQTWLEYTVKNNIFVNCGKSGQTIKGLNGGQGGKNPVWAIDGNVFNFEGVDTSADETTGDDAEPITNSIAVVVNFADAANGDFTQSDAKAGDPIWIK